MWLHWTEMLLGRSASLTPWGHRVSSMDHRLRAAMLVPAAEIELPSTRLAGAPASAKPIAWAR
jgi:hypothetical protein